MDPAEQKETQKHSDKAKFDELIFSQRVDEAPDESRLHDNSQESHIRKNIADFFSAKRGALVGESAFGKERKTGNKDDERENEKQELPQERTEFFILKTFPINMQSEFLVLPRFRVMGSARRIRKKKISARDTESRKPRRHENGILMTEACEKT